MKSARLYYWRSDNYRNDLDEGAAYHLNQANPVMHAIDPGDSLWPFTRNRRGHYVLAAELVVRASQPKTFHSRNVSPSPIALLCQLPSHLLKSAPHSNRPAMSATTPGAAARST